MHGKVLSLFSLSLSLAIPWLGLLSHVSSLILPSGHSGLVLTLSNAARSVWATSPLGVAVRSVISGFYLFIFSSWLCCSLRFQNSPQTHWREGFLVLGNFSFTTPSPGWVSVPNSFCLFFYLLYFVLPLSKIMGCLSGCLVSSASIQNLFYGIFSAFK